MPAEDSDHVKDRTPVSSDSAATNEEPRLLSGPGRTKRLSTRRAWTIIATIAVAALVSSLAWIYSDMAEPEITIVAILPITGVSSYLIEIEDAMTLMVEKLNKWGGINGVRIRLIVEDCASSPELAVDKLLEAEEQYHPLAVITATRNAAADMAEIAEELGIVLICIGATSEELTEDKDWVFRYYVTPKGEASNALEVVTALNVTSLGILHLSDAYGIPIKDQLTESFASMNGTVESIGFLPNCTEFTQHVADLTDNEAIFAVALRHQFPLILDTLDSSGYEGHVICGVEASIPEIWTTSEAQGIYVSAPVMYSPAAAIDISFLEEFENLNGSPLTHQGAIGSDALKLIWGLLSDTDVSRDNLRNLMSGGYVFSGIMGVVVVEENDHNADISVYPAVIEDGELAYL